MEEEEKVESEDPILLYQQALVNRGDIFMFTGRYDDALLDYKRIYKDKNILKLKRAEALRKCADVYKHQANTDMAFEYIGKAKEMIHGNSKEAKSELAAIRTIRAWLFYSQGKMDNAINENKKVLKLSAELPKEQRANLQSATYNTLGSIYLNLGDYDKALEAYGKFYAVGKEYKMKRYMAIASGNIGVVYNYLKDSAKSLRYYNKQLKISEEIGYLQGIAIALVNLGIINKNKKKYDTAELLYKRCLTLFESMSDFHGMAIVSVNLGLIYYEKGIYKKALELFNNYLKISNRCGDLKGTGIAYKYMGHVCSKKNNHIEALKHFKKYLRISRKVKFKHGICRAYFSMGEENLILGNKLEGISLLKKSEKLAYELQDTGLLENIRKLIENA